MLPRAPPQGATAHTHASHLQVAGGLPPRRHSRGSIECDGLGLDGRQAREVGASAAGEARCLAASRAGGKKTLLAEEAALGGRRLRRGERELGTSERAQHICALSAHQCQAKTQHGAPEGRKQGGNMAAAAGRLGQCSDAAPRARTTWGDMRLPCLFYSWPAPRNVPCQCAAHAYATIVTLLERNP